MKKAAAILMALGLLAQGVMANVLDVAGVATSVNPTTNTYFKVGDFVHFYVRYTPPNTVNELFIYVNNNVLNPIRTVGGTGNFVTIDENPADGTVQWSLVTAHGSSFDVATNTPGGVIPCIDSFDLGKSFSVVVGNIIVNGTVVAKPLNRTGQ